MPHTQMSKVWFAAGLGVLTVVLLLVGLNFDQKPETGSPGTAARRVLYYRDPMHPSYTSPKPGKAPDCGMDLEPVYAGQTGSTQGSMEDAIPTPPPNIVQISPEQ